MGTNLCHLQYPKRTSPSALRARASASLSRRQSPWRCLGRMMVPPMPNCWHQFSRFGNPHHRLVLVARSLSGKNKSKGRTSARPSELICTMMTMNPGLRTPKHGTSVTQRNRGSDLSPRATRRARVPTITTTRSSRARRAKRIYQTPSRNLLALCAGCLATLPPSRICSLGSSPSRQPCTGCTTTLRLTRTWVLQCPLSWRLLVARVWCPTRTTTW
mmetsp:Transcript_17423/g.40989  ORF Transcript_17423/g.40989 Transcript_17423/m.40989 type:complete len:216 (-) Transcript_17423:1392-2039(-)